MLGHFPPRGTLGQALERYRRLLTLNAALGVCTALPDSKVVDQDVSFCSVLCADGSGSCLSPPSPSSLAVCTI